MYMNKILYFCKHVIIYAIENIQFFRKPRGNPNDFFFFLNSLLMYTHYNMCYMIIYDNSSNIEVMIYI